MSDKPELIKSSQCLCGHHADKHFRNREDCMGCPCTGFGNGGPRVWPTARVSLLFKTPRGEHYAVTALTRNAAHVAAQSPDELVSTSPLYSRAEMLRRRNP